MEEANSESICLVTAAPRAASVKALMAAEFLIGIAVAALGLSAAASHLGDIINAFDEGHIISGANSILLGAIPHRDFYTSYPPGIFFLVAGLWRMFGVSPLTPRVLNLALHVGLGVLSGSIAGRCVGRRFLWIPCGLVILWSFELGNYPWSYVAGLAMALLMVELLGRAWSGGSSLGWLGAGLAWGALLGFRHDFWVYLTLALGLLYCLVWALNRELVTGRVSLRSFGMLFLGGVLSVAAIWGPTLARADPTVILSDLLLDQVRYVMPARRLPFRSLWTPQAASGLSPAFLSQNREGAVLFSIAAPFFTLIGLSIESSWVFETR